MINGWVLLGSFALEYQGALLKQALEDEGIESIVVDRKDSAYRFLGQVEVYVKQAFFLKAMHVKEKTQL